MRLFRSSRTGPLMHLSACVVAYAAYVPVPVISTVRLYQRRSTATNIRRASEDEKRDRGAHTTNGYPSASPRVNIYATGSVQAVQHSLASATLAQGFLQFCHEHVELRRSAIHGRGLVATADISQGTRVLTAPTLYFTDAPSYVKLLSDSRGTLLPESRTYVHCSGALNEVVLRGLPHHFVNHSCEPSVRGGLCRALWGRGIASCNEQLVQFIKSAEAGGGVNDERSCFADPNSLFATRDIRAGEELTVDYSLRSGPLYGGAPSMSHTATCRCGSASCRGQIYRPSERVAKMLLEMESHGRQLSVEELLAVGFDDELTVVGLQSDEALLAWYLCGVNENVTMSKTKKGKVIATYRHVFKALNSAAPSSA